jgi:hypothetical protein
MALAYDARRSTRDIDAVLQPHGMVLDEARAVAGELGLPQWWLNEQASAYVAPGGDANAPRVFDHPGLRVSAAFPEHPLAMKVLAARWRDADDIRFLVKHLNKPRLTSCSPCAPRSSPTRRCPRGHVWFWKTPSTTGRTRGQDLIGPHPAPVT